MMHTFPTRKSWKHKALILADAWRLLAGYARLRRALVQPVCSCSRPGPTCVVVLLSHNRPQNMSLIIRCALHNSWVKKIIVSNSNPQVNIADFIDIDDDRLVLVNELHLTQPGHRFTVAAETDDNYFLSIDDDIFLTPQQWTALFQKLIAEDAVPHGITGNLYAPGSISGNGSPFHHVSSLDHEVDVLIGAYAFTRQHLDQMFSLANKLGIGPMSELRNGEDVLLSLSGEGRPRIHAIGPFLTCASESAPGIALWQSHRNFWDERVRLFERAREARSVANAR